VKLIYPAHVVPNEDKEGYTVTVPDIDCVTESGTLSEAITKSIELASEILLKELESGNPIPKPTIIEYMNPAPGGFLTVLMIDIDEYGRKTGAGFVKKSLSIPRWLNSFAESQKIDYLELIQNALTSLYEEQHYPDIELSSSYPEMKVED